MKFYRARHTETGEFFTTQKRTDGIFHKIGASKSAFSTCWRWRGAKYNSWDDAKDDYEIIEYKLIPVADIGYLREDNDGHRYVIPENKVKEFDNLSALVDGYSYDDWAEKFGEPNPFDTFLDFYQDYGVEGDLYNMKILIN